MTTSSITFRIDDLQIEQLRKLADEKQVSLNTCVSHILNSHLEFEFIATKLGFAPLHKSAIREMLDEMPEERITQIATRSADSLKDALLLLFGRVDLEAVVCLMERQAKRSGFVLRGIENGRTDAAAVDERASKKMVMQHDLGHNWSVFFKSHIERLINNVGYASKIEFTSNSLVIEILANEMEVKHAYAQSLS